MAWDFQQCGMCDQQRLRPACAYAQSDESLCKSLEYFMTVKLLTEHLLGFLNVKGGCIDTSESTLVKIPHCWKSHVVDQLFSYKSTQTAVVYCHNVLYTNYINIIISTRKRKSISIYHFPFKNCLFFW